MPAFDAYAETLARGHVAPVYMSPLFGSIVYTAEVSATPTFPAKAIAITGGSGTVGNIVRGARIVFTDALGVWKGQSHIRFSGTISSATLPIRETASGTIDIAAGDLVTVYSLPLLVEKLVEADEAFNPDGVAVSDTNQYPYPLACSGGWYVNFLPDSGSLVIPTYGADSTTVDIDSAGTETHGWATSGGTLSSTSAVSPTLTVSAAGEYRLVHTVTDDTNGKISTQYVPLRVHDANDPPLEGVLNGVDGDPHAGYRASITLFENATLADLPDGTPVIVWVDERLGGEALSYGHKVDGRSNILMVGYLRRDEWELGDDGAEGLTFEVISPLARLQEIAGYSKVMENNATPDAWSEIKDLNMSRAMIQLLMHYTNALELFDLLFIGFIDKDYPALFLQRSTPYDQVKELADGVVSRIICDRAGRLEIQRRLEATPLDERATPATTITLTKEIVADWRMTREHYEPLDTLHTNGFTKGYSGNAAFFCKFPASPGGGTQIAQITRLVVNDYADALETTALLGAWENRVFFDADGIKHHAPELTITLYGGYSRLFQFYREWVAFSGVTTLRGVDLSDFRWILMSVSETIEDGAATTTLTLRAETHAPASAAADDPQTGDGVPPADPPGTFPPVVNPPVRDSDGLGVGVGTLAAFTLDAELLITRNFKSASPAWAEIDLTGLSGWGGGMLIDFAVDPFSPLYLGTGTQVNGVLLTTTGMQTISDIFGTPALGTFRSFGDTSNARILQTSRWTRNLVMVASYVYSVGTYITYSADMLASAPATNTLSTHYNSSSGMLPRPGLCILPNSNNAYATNFTNTATGASSTVEARRLYGGGVADAVLSTPVIAPVNLLAGAITVWAQGDGSVVYYGSSTYNGSNYEYDLMRSGSAISPSHGGAEYGIPTQIQNGATQRAFSLADDDPNYAWLCGQNVSAAGAAVGVWRTTQAGSISGTGSSAWINVVEPVALASALWLGVYVPNRTLAILIGANGNIGTCTDGVNIVSRKGDIVSTATIIGICGG